MFAAASERTNIAVGLSKNGRGKLPAGIAIDASGIHEKIARRVGGKALAKIRHKTRITKRKNELSAANRGVTCAEGFPLLSHLYVQAGLSQASG